MSDNTSIKARPIKDDSNYNAVGNPIVYKLRREDAGYVGINDVGGNAQIQIFAGPDLTLYFEVGDLVYIAFYNGIATVTAVEYTDGSTLITTDRPYVSSSVGYINDLNKRTDYRIEVELFNADTNESMGPRISATPSVSGDVSINVAGIASASLSPDWSPATPVSKETTTSVGAYIKFEEYYNGEYHGVESDAANPIICVFAVMNLLQNSPPNFKRYQHGGNMYPFVHFEMPGLMWPTRFPALSMWRGWPFTVSFASANYASLIQRMKQYDSAGVELSNTTMPLDMPNGDGFYRMNLDTVNPNASEIILSIERLGNFTHFRDITVKVKDPQQQPVLLVWKNSLGGDAWWMFDESQEYKYAYPSGRKVTRMKLYTDNLTIGEWDAINEMNSPSDVIASNLTDFGMNDSVDKTNFRMDNQVYIVNQDGEKVGVIVIETDNQTKTMFKKHAAEITIELPELFTV